MKRAVIDGSVSATRALERKQASNGSLRASSSTASASARSSSDGASSAKASGEGKEAAKQKQERPAQKTQAELDEEMRQKMASLAGDGGEAGVELEDGKPVAMKRGVRENMFRLI